MRTNAACSRAVRAAILQVLIYPSNLPSVVSGDCSLEWFFMLKVRCDKLSFFFLYLKIVLGTGEDTQHTFYPFLKYLLL